MFHMLTSYPQSRSVLNVPTLIPFVMETTGVQQQLAKELSVARLLALSSLATRYISHATDY